MCMGRNLLLLMTWLGMRNSLRSNMNGLTEEYCRYVIHWGRIFCFLHGLLRTLRKNLLLLCWAFFFFFFLFSVLDSLGKNLLLPYRAYFRCTWFTGDTQPGSSVRGFVLTYAGLFLRLCICGNGPAYVGVMFTYVGFDPRMWDAWQKLYSAHFHFLFNRFTTICNPNTPFVIFSSKHRYILLFIFILTSKISFFINFAWIKNLMPSSSFLHPSSPYAGRGSTNKVVKWYNLLVPETKVYI